MARIKAAKKYKQNLDIPNTVTNDFLHKQLII